MTSDQTVSVIIPTWNEADLITSAVTCALALAEEVWVVDGGSDDATLDRAKAAGARTLTSEKGRGIQLHQGARQAQGDILLFLHADVRLPPDARHAIQSALSDPAVIGGNFMIRFYPLSRFARVLAWANDWRRRLSHRYYGDSGIFVRREVYHRLGGFEPIPLMEDYNFSRCLEQNGQTVYLRNPHVIASTRRFQDRWPETVARWVGIQLLHWLGVSPWRLAGAYPDVRSRDNSDFLRAAARLIEER